MKESFFTCLPTDGRRLCSMTRPLPQGGTMSSGVLMSLQTEGTELQATRFGKAATVCNVQLEPGDIAAFCVRWLAK